MVGDLQIIDSDNQIGKSPGRIMNDIQVNIFSLNSLKKILDTVFSLVKVRHRSPSAEIAQ
jgi:hypothetical protein